MQIPMRGKIDSLNVSVSAGIIIFEALRQRK
jgi:tRNA G18 (ribose-2'-O)-methylase SpoU